MYITSQCLCLHRSSSLVAIIPLSNSPPPLPPPPRRGSWEEHPSGHSGPSCHVISPQCLFQTTTSTWHCNIRHFCYIHHAIYNFRITIFLYCNSSVHTEAKQQDWLPYMMYSTHIYSNNFGGFASRWFPDFSRDAHRFCTVQTMDLSLPCIRRIPKMHSWIESKFMLRLFLCILGLFLPPIFTLCPSGKFMLSCHQAGRDMAPVRIPNETKYLYKMFRE